MRNLSHISTKEIKNQLNKLRKTVSLFCLMTDNNFENSVIDNIDIIINIYNITLHISGVIIYIIDRLMIIEYIIHTS